MSENVLRQAVQEATSDPATIQTPTTTHYQQLVTELTATLASIEARIPAFEAFHPMTAAFIAQNRAFPLEFISTTLAAVEANPDLQKVQKFDVTEVRDSLQFLEAFKPLAIQVDKLARDLRFTMDALKAKATADSLQMYAIAKGIVRDPSSAGITAHLEQMKIDLGRTRPKRRDKTTPEPVPDPTGAVAAKAA